MIEKQILRILKKNSGITIISLAITIIIIIILSAVSINAIFSDKGLINQAEYSKIVQNHSAIEESLYSKVSYLYLKEFGEITNEEIMEYLKNNNIINDAQEVNVKVLLGTTLSTGNGNNERDVYKVEEGTLYYYNEQGEREEINQIFNIAEEQIPQEPTPEEYFDFDPSTGTISLKGAILYTEMGNDEFPLTEIIVPSTYNGQKVKKIGDFTYKNIEKVVISEGIETIGYGAFGYVKTLTTVEIPQSITTIEDFAFFQCTNISSLTIPNTVKYIGDAVFFRWTASQVLNIDYISEPNEWDIGWDRESDAQINWIGK